MRNILRRRASEPQHNDIVRRQIISQADPNERLSVSDERLQSEIRDLMKDQRPGRYRVRVRRRLVRL
jgi:uncharacterized protein (UPF0335 family)